MWSSDYTGVVKKESSLPKVVSGPAFWGCFLQFAGAVNKEIFSPFLIHVPFMSHAGLFPWKVKGLSRDKALFGDEGG